MDVQSYDLAWQDRWDDMKRYGPYSRHVRRFIHKFIREIEFETFLMLVVAKVNYLELISKKTTRAKMKA